MIASGQLDTGQLLTVLWAVVFGALSLGSIGPRVASFAKALAAYQEIFQTIQRLPCIDSSDPNGKRPSNIKGDIWFKNVSFIYPSRPEGIVLSSVPRLMCSYCFERYKYPHSSREIHGDRWSFGIGKINDHPTSGTVLRSG